MQNIKGPVLNAVALAGICLLGWYIYRPVDGVDLDEREQSGSTATGNSIHQTPANGPREQKSNPQQSVIQKTVLPDANRSAENDLQNNDLMTYFFASAASKFKLKWIKKSGYVPIIQVFDQNTGDPQAHDQWLADSLIISTNADQTVDELSAELKDFGVITVRSLGTQKLWSAEISPATLDEYFAICRKVRSSQKVAGISYNQIMTLQKTSNDPLLPLQYGIGDLKTHAFVSQGKNLPVKFQTTQDPKANLAADLAWNTKRDCRPVRIGVIDSGIDESHPDLKDNLNLALSRNFASERKLSQDCTKNPPEFDETKSMTPDTTKFSDENGHGTHVAGTIGATGNNLTGVSGVCWRAEIIALRVANKCGSSDRASILSAFNFAKSINVRIINISMSGPMFYDTDAAKAAEKMSSDAVEAFIKSGGLVVAAAGNETKDMSIVTNFRFPASLDFSGILAIGSINANNQLSHFSNYSSSKIHAVTPGERILSTYPVTLNAKNLASAKVSVTPILASLVTSFQDAIKAAPAAGYEFLDGTSMAAPHAAGAAALVWSMIPHETNVAIAQIMLDTSDQVPELADKIQFGRRINVKRAVDSVTGYSAAATANGTKNTTVAVSRQTPVLIRIPSGSGLQHKSAKLLLGQKIVGSCSDIDESCTGQIPADLKPEEFTSAQNLTVNDGAKSLDAGTLKILELPAGNGIFSAVTAKSLCRAFKNGNILSVFSSPDVQTCRNVCRILLSGLSKSNSRCEFRDLTFTPKAENCAVE